MGHPPAQSADPRRPQIARAHFATLATLFNPTTFGHIERLGIAAGWRCWEAGAGGPTVPAWLAERVGPDGYVLATDRDVSGLQATAGPGTAGPGTAGPGYEIRQHDLGAEPPPAADFDLVHARLVLMHLPGRDAVLPALAQALRPGGWLLVEDADPLLLPLACPDQAGPGQELANKIRQATWELISRRSDLAWGRTLPRRLRSAGLVDVGADAYLSLAGPAQAQFQKTIIERQRQALVTAGLATGDEIDRHLNDIGTGELDLASFPLVSSWGRKAA
jgi:SAM-dependent methyltransferase